MTLEPLLGSTALYRDESVWDTVRDGPRRRAPPPNPSSSRTPGTAGPPKMIKSPVSAHWCVLARAAIRQRVVHIKAIEKDDLRRAPQPNPSSSRIPGTAGAPNPLSQRLGLHLICTTSLRILASATTDRGPDDLLDFVFD